jgi:hypothetical protein
VTDIEEAGALAHSLVLFQNARVLDGHLPPAELDQARAQFAVSLEQRCSFEACWRRLGRGHVVLPD